MQWVSRFEGKFVFDLQHRNAACNRIHIDQAYGSWSGFDCLNQSFVGADHHDRRMICPAMVGSCDQSVYLVARHAINLFQHHLHLGRCRIEAKQDHRFPRGPAVSLPFADLHQVRHADFGHAIGFIGNQSHVFGIGGSRPSRDYQPDCEHTSAKHRSLPRYGNPQTDCPRRRADAQCQPESGYQRRQYERSVINA